MGGIINRIKSLFKSVIGGVEQWVLSLITTVHDLIWRLFTAAEQAAHDVRVALDMFAHALGSFATRIYTFAKWIAQHLIPAIIDQVKRWIRDVSNAINYVAHWAEKWIVRLVNDIISLGRSLTRWVIRNVWNPLFKAISTAWHWITHEGYFVWHLLTHPDLVAKMLARYIWASWLDLFRKYSPEIMKWLLHQMPRLVGPLTTLMENFISDLLS